MKSAKLYRTRSRFWGGAKRLIAYYQTQIIICGIIFLLGIVLGVIIITSNTSNLDFDNIFDKNITLLLKGTRSPMSVFIWSILTYSITFLVTIFLNFMPWMFTFSVAALFINGYIIGYNFTIMIVLFGLPGFLNAIFVLMPFYLILGTLIVLLNAIQLKRNITISKYGCSYYNKITHNNHKQLVLCVVGVFLLVLFVQCLLLPLMRITIIIKT